MPRREISNDNTHNDEIIIRAAKPEKDEGIVFAQFLDEASEGFIKSMLGNKVYEIISDAYVKSNNDYSFENAYMIEFKSEVVGIVSGYTTVEKEGFNRQILSQSSKGGKFRIKMFSFIGRILSRFLGPRGKEEFYIQAIAVSRHIRGQGLGQRLLKHISGIAIKKGSKKLSLDVSSKNIKAINSYKKFDMEVSSYWPNFLKLPPVFSRMEKKL